MAKRSVFALVLALSLPGFACDRVAGWWGREDRATPTEILAHGPAGPLRRAEAAAALIAAGEAERVQRALTGMGPDERTSVVAYLAYSMLPRLVRHESMVERGRGLDALVTVRALASDEIARDIDLYLLREVRRILRAGAAWPGSRPVEDIVSLCGARSPALLLSLLDIPGAPHDTAFAILMRSPDPVIRGALAPYLIEKIGRAPEQDDSWTALGRLEEGTGFLLRAAQKPPLERQLRAARALQHARRSEAVVATARDVVLAAGSPPPLRQELVRVLETQASPSARRALLAVIEEAATREDRWHAFAAVLTVGGAGAILPALEALPRSSLRDRNTLARLLVEHIHPSEVVESRKALTRARRSRSRVARAIAGEALRQLPHRSTAPPPVSRLSD